MDPHIVMDRAWVTLNQHPVLDPNVRLCPRDAYNPVFLARPL